MNFTKQFCADALFGYLNFYPAPVINSRQLTFSFSPCRVSAAYFHSPKPTGENNQL